MRAVADGLLDEPPGQRGKRDARGYLHAARGRSSVPFAGMVSTMTG